MRELGAELDFAGDEDSDVAAFPTGPVIGILVRERREVGVASEVVPAARRHRGEDAVEMIAAGQHFAAGVRVVQTQDEMLGALLDSEG